MAAQKYEASSTKKGKTRNPKIKNNCIWEGQLVDQNQGHSAQEREGQEFQRLQRITRSAKEFRAKIVN